MIQLSLPLIKTDRLFFITSGRLYLAFNDRWTEGDEWALKFTRFEAMHKIVELECNGVTNLKMKESK